MLATELRSACRPEPFTRPAHGAPRFPTGLRQAGDVCSCRSTLRGAGDTTMSSCPCGVHVAASHSPTFRFSFTKYHFGKIADKGQSATLAFTQTPWPCRVYTQTSLRVKDTCPPAHSLQLQAGPCQWCLCFQHCTFSILMYLIYFLPGWGLNSGSPARHATSPVFFFFFNLKNFLLLFFLNSFN